MRVLIFIIVLVAALAIYFVGINTRLTTKKAATSAAAVKAIPNSSMWILIAAWSVVCAVVGGVVSRCTERPSKETVLTVVDKVADKDSVTTYFRLSDGHTIKISSRNMGNDELYDSWVMVKKGDKVRKLIFENKQARYTPEFEENILK